jgi:hypothetical protein
MTDPTAHDAKLTAAWREQDLRQRTKNIVNILGALLMSRIASGCSAMPCTRSAPRCQ